jgi:hypothetical protein
MPAAATVEIRTIADPDMIGQPLNLMQRADLGTAELLLVNRNHPLRVS